MRCRKKPIVIDAYQLTRDEYRSYVFLGIFTDAPFWLRNSRDITKSNGAIYVKTLEGMMKVKEGDYIMRGVDGELYPCDASIFERTYEVLEGDG